MSAVKVCCALSMLLMSTTQMPAEICVGPELAFGRSINAGVSAPSAASIDIATRTRTGKWILIATGNRPDSVLEFGQLLELLEDYIARRDPNRRLTPTALLPDASSSMELRHRSCW